jgi:hypothetical protein
MNRRLKRSVLGTMLLFQLSMSTSGMAAAKPKFPTPAPVPAQLLTARRIFIANAGEDQPFFDASLFTGGSERAYDDFYAGMNGLGKYELVSSPDNADLLFEIEMMSPRAGPRVSEMPNVLGDVPYDVSFRLKIRDPKTNALLWTCIEHVQWAILQGNRDRNFAQAIQRLITDMQALATRATAAVSKQ